MTERTKEAIIAMGHSISIEQVGKDIRHSARIVEALLITEGLLEEAIERLSATTERLNAFREWVGDELGESEKEMIQDNRRFTKKVDEEGGGVRVYLKEQIAEMGHDKPLLTRTMSKDIEWKDAWVVKECGRNRFLNAQARFDDLARAKLLTYDDALAWADSVEDTVPVKADHYGVSNVFHWLSSNKENPNG